MANDLPARRQGAVVPGVNSHNVRRSTFQAKLAVAGEQMQSGRAKSDRRAAEARRTNAVANQSRPTAVKTSASGYVASNRYVQTQGLASPHRQIGLLPAARQRLRRFNKSTPKQLRESLSHLATEFGLTVIDVRSDIEKQAVVLIIDQPGYSRTRFIVECVDAVWQVDIEAGQQSDAHYLQGKGEALQERFERARLGPVMLPVRSPASSK